MSMDPGEAELAAIRSQFCLVVARWRLTQSDLRLILGEGMEPCPECRILPNWLTADAERRMRLLVRLDNALLRRSPDGGIATPLKEANLLRHGRIRLDVLADLAALRSMIAWAECGHQGEIISPAFRNDCGPKAC